MDNIPEDFEPYFELFSHSSSSSSSRSNNDDDVCDQNVVLFDDRVKACLTCGVEQIYNRFSNGDEFECWNLGKTFHKLKPTPQKQQCTSTTIRGHQCTHGIMDNCTFCDNPLENGDSRITLGKKGCDIIIKISSDRQQEILTVPCPTVHHECRRELH
ncbi:unnamed protein product [Mytilus coruscus]|uniref:Uncharacterized protein n=1 Tax=Mytilus coruscus TaxID=42192 RepID=A0A6J8EW51_MYTCO|nr:unnamed protein product [Mytilus coruscus]